MTKKLATNHNYKFDHAKGYLYENKSCPCVIIVISKKSEFAHGYRNSCIKETPLDSLLSSNKENSL